MLGRYAYSCQVLSNPITNTDAKLVTQIKKSVACDEYTFDWSEAMKKMLTGYVPLGWGRESERREHGTE